METIGRQKLKEIKNWFTRYVRLFKNGNAADRRNMDLKEEHTFKVCDEMINIGKKLGLDGNGLRLAQVIALLHDVGRFEQYAVYKTFLDRESENHAELGVKILKKHGVLKGFDGSTEQLILRAVECHNRASLPSGEGEPRLFFIKLLRDADKLDIWRVVLEYYHRNGGRRNRAIELGLPDTAGISERVYQDVTRKRIVDVKHIRNLNDFKVLQMAWIYDINFKPTLDCIQRRRYLEMIRDVLPETDSVRRIYAVVREHRAQRLGAEIPWRSAKDKRPWMRSTGS